MRIYVLLAVLVLFLISACAPEVPAGPRREGIPVEVEVTDPCEGISCIENQLCVEGTCVCSEGFKACGDSCISITSCCTSEECGEGLVCEEGTCVKRLCDFNEEYDAERDECSCASGTKYCKQQQRCIPKDHCCHINDCPSDESCAETNYIATVCLKNGKTSCKSVAETRSDAFFIDDQRYDISFEHLFQDGIFTLQVNDQTLTEVEVAQELNVITGVTLFVEKFEILGGWCKEDED